MVVKTYRGLLKDGAQDKIPLSTKDGSVGYRIVKYQIIPEDPQTATQEIVVKIYNEEQSTIDGTVNFSDASLLGVALYSQHSSSYNSFKTVIFDNSLVNRDIYVTVKDAVGAGGANYYIELEQMKLDQTQNMSATLKAIRGSAVD